MRDNEGKVVELLERIAVSNESVEKMYKQSVERASRLDEKYEKIRDEQDAYEMSRRAVREELEALTLERSKLDLEQARKFNSL